MINIMDIDKIEVKFLNTLKGPFYDSPFEIFFLHCISSSLEVSPEARLHFM